MKEGGICLENILNKTKKKNVNYEKNGGKKMPVRKERESFVEQWRRREEANQASDRKRIAEIEQRQRDEEIKRQEEQKKREEEARRQNKERQQRDSER